jgi:hypothetical protein
MSVDWMVLQLADQKAEKMAMNKAVSMVAWKEKTMVV